jgi:hypothetical protein
MCPWPVWHAGGSGLNCIATIWFIMAVWFANSWLIAVETSEGIVALLVTAFVAPPEVLPAVAATAVWVIVVSSSITSSSPSPNTLYMLLLGFRTYPCCPAVLRSWIDVRRLVYASCTKVLRMGYVYLATHPTYQIPLMGIFLTPSAV